MGRPKDKPRTGKGRSVPCKLCGGRGMYETGEPGDLNWQWCYCPKAQARRDAQKLDEAKGLIDLGGGALAVTFASGTRRGITCATLPPYEQLAGSYSGENASWGEATLSVSKGVLLVEVHAILEHDGGHDRTVLERWSSHDQGRSWEPMTLVRPTDARWIGSVSSSA